MGIIERIGSPSVGNQTGIRGRRALDGGRRERERKGKGRERARRGFKELQVMLTLLAPSNAALACIMHEREGGGVYVEGRDTKRAILERRPQRR